MFADRDYLHSEGGCDANSMTATPNEPTKPASRGQLSARWWRRLLRRFFTASAPNHAARQGTTQRQVAGALQCAALLFRGL